jgi:C-terminal processing protease CtpA/Prc
MIKRALVLLLIALPLAAADAVPGWIGIGYHYRISDGKGWMLIQHLDPAGPAAKAGLRQRDIVTHVDGKVPNAPDQLAMIQELRRVKRGQKVKFTVRRGDQTVPIVFTAARMTPQQERMWRESLEYEKSRRR